MSEKTMTDLEKCFYDASINQSEYIAVLIEMEGFPEPEVIINPLANFDAKFAYYKKAYTDDLTLKTFSGIRTRDFTHGDNYEEIETALVCNLPF
jgi:hypothetical protein